MGDIRTVVDRTQNLTINVAEGPLAIDEILGAIERYLTQDPTLKVLWDFRGADGGGIDSQDIVRLQDVVRNLAPAGERRKVAIVVARDLGYGLSRMAESRGEMAGITADYFVTRSMAEAQAWLGVSRA